MKSKVRMKRLVFWLVPLVVSVVVQLFVSNVLAGGGEELADIERKTQEVEKQNNVLREQLGTAGSLQRLAKESQALGLVKATSIVYISLVEGEVLSGTPNLLGSE